MLSSRFYLSTITSGPPYADTLAGSKYPNMKELRFDADNGVWRLVFAFDLKRHAVLLIAGDKSGTSQKCFYKQLIKKADERFTLKAAVEVIKTRPCFDRLSTNGFCDAHPIGE